MLNLCFGSRVLLMSYDVELIVIACVFYVFRCHISYEDVTSFKGGSL